MCGGRISRLPENETFEGYIARDDGGFMFHMLLPNVSKVALEDMLTTGETKVAKLLKRMPFTPLYVCGDKHFLRDQVQALNKVHGLLGVNAQKVA